MHLLVFSFAPADLIKRRLICSKDIVLLKVTKRLWLDFFGGDFVSLLFSLRSQPHSSPNSLHTDGQSHIFIVGESQETKWHRSHPAKLAELTEGTAKTSAKSLQALWQWMDPNHLSTMWDFFLFRCFSPALVMTAHYSAVKCSWQYQKEIDFYHVLRVSMATKIQQIANLNVDGNEICMICT